MGPTRTDVARNGMEIHHPKNILRIIFDAVLLQQCNEFLPME